MTSVLMHPAPIVGTFHAAGRNASYQILDRCAALAHRAPRTQGGGVQGRPGARRDGSSAPGLRHPVQRRRDRRASPATPPTPTASPTIFFCGRHEERKGLAVLLEAFRSLPADDPAVDRQRRSRRPAAARRVRRRQAHHVARADQRRREVRPPARGDGVLRAVAARRVVRRRADRGDGGRHAGRRQRHRRLPQRGHRRRRRPAHRAGRRRRRSAAAIGAVLDDRLLTESLRAAGHRRAEDFSMTTLAAEYIAHLPPAARRRRAAARPSEPLARRGAHPRSLRRPPAGSRPIRLRQQAPLVHSEHMTHRPHRHRRRWWCC